MQKYLKEHTVGRVIFMYAAILVGVLTGITGFFSIADKIATLRSDLTRLERDFINEQKLQLQSDVGTLISRIESQQELLLHQLEQELANRVDEAEKIAVNISSSIRNRVEPSVVVDTIREAIRPIRFNDKQGYCFIINRKGDAILYPAEPSLEGTNFFTNNFGDSATVAREMIEMTALQGKGFLRYDWYKPGDSSGALYPKITYVSLIEELGLIFATGEYLDNLEDLARSSIVDELKNSWRSTLMDYYFVYQLHDMQGGPDFATMLININRPDLEGRTISETAVDAKGKAYRKEFMDGIRDKGEAHVVYWYKKPDGSGIGRKLSYFKLYPRWNWIVARGIYLDRLDADIAIKQQEQMRRVRNEILRLGFIFLFGIGLSLLLAYWFSRQLQIIFDQYRADRRQHLEELKELNRKLETQSRTDALTGIANRAFFNEALEQSIEQVKRYGENVCLLLLDIDHFKLINDNHGHLTGDQVLQDLSRLVQANIRRVDLFARWGGEEFVILTPGINVDQAMQVAEKLRYLIMVHQFPGQLDLTCSFGLGQYVPGEKIHEFIHRVDTALYLAKERGRNRCVGASAS